LRNKEKLKENYLAAAETNHLKVNREKKKLFYLSLSRLITFCAGLLIVWFGYSRSPLVGTLAFILSAVFFLFLLKRFSIHSFRKDFFTNLETINRNEADAVSGNYSHFGEGQSFVNTDHDFSHDIDLFGKSSLFQYLNRTSTGYGGEILAKWLSEPLGLSKQLEVRQKAIREVAAKDLWRHEFMAHGMDKNLNRDRITGLIKWIEEDSTRSSGIRKVLLYLLPAAGIFSLILTITGIIPYTIFLLLFFGNLLYISFGLKKTGRIHESLSGKYNFLSSIKTLLDVFENEPFESEIFSDIRNNISGKKFSASESVNNLGKLIQAFDSRMNVFVGFVLNGLLLWDYQCISRLEKWKSKYKIHFPVWLEMLGQVDAFISLGNYSFNNPDFVYPGISVDKNVFTALKLGHQLIAEEKRVHNDFTISSEGVVSIISGANMAGKSTFLRTVAINYLLAMTGAPVCAGKMTFKPMSLYTSMRTTDSLATNESYFYAELKRLRSLKARISEGEKLFFILDEILKGTNSDDKSIGSKLFIKRLVELGGTGLIATHDTSLGEMENETPEAITNHCFEVELDGENILFDYKLRDGITKKKNAVLLMKQMGILD
jgi:hypothetical protein